MLIPDIRDIILAIIVIYVKAERPYNISGDRDNAIKK